MKHQHRHGHWTRYGHGHGYMDIYNVQNIERNTGVVSVSDTGHDKGLTCSCFIGYNRFFLSINVSFLEIRSEKFEIVISFFSLFPSF